MVAAHPGVPKVAVQLTIGEFQEKIEVHSLAAVVLVILVEVDMLPAVNTAAPAAPPHVEVFVCKPPDVATNPNELGRILDSHSTDVARIPMTRLTRAGEDTRGEFS
jgi:hypothetical protein